MNSDTDAVPVERSFGDAAVLFEAYSGVAKRVDQYRRATDSCYARPTLLQEYINT